MKVYSQPVDYSPVIRLKSLVKKNIFAGLKNGKFIYEDHFS